MNTFSILAALSFHVMKPKLRIVALVRVLLTSLWLFSLVQFSYSINVEGYVQVGRGAPAGALVHTVMDGYRLDVFEVEEHGKYKLELEYNHKYELIFSSKGNYPKRILVETNVPDFVIVTESYFPSIVLDINLFAEVEGIKFPFVEKPVRKISYHPESHQFVSVVYLDDSEIIKTIDQAFSWAQMFKNEKNFLSNLTGFELAEMKREYNRILELAEKDAQNHSEAPILNTFNDAGSSGMEEMIFQQGNETIDEVLRAIIFIKERDKKQPEKLDDFIRQGDTRLNRQKYTSAMVSYQRALSIAGNDDYVAGQINRINDLMKQQLELEQYKNLLAFADNSYDELLFTEAAKKYHDALQIKPDETYPKTRLHTISEILEKETKSAGKSQSYKQTLKEAEAMYHKQFYEKSLASFHHALNLEPGDSWPAQRIFEIETEMNELADQLMYDQCIVSANKFYRKEKYPEAMKAYFAASEIIPGDQFAQIRINAIDQKLYQEEKFDFYISEADELFADGEYSRSRENYLEALKINTTDKHTRNRIDEIDFILAHQIKKYRDNSTLAFTGESVQTSHSGKEKTNAQTAGESRIETNSPTRTEKQAEYEISKLPNAGIAAVLKNESVETAIASEAELGNIYEDYISRADELFGDKKYIDSRSWYYKALDVNQNGNYPNLKINQINQLLDEMPKSPEDREYLHFVDLADSTFYENQFAVARGWYNRALGVKADEQYPKDQLKEIEHKIAKRLADQSGQQFASDLQKAKAAFESKNYNVARFWYKKALELRPENREVKGQLSQIEELLKLSNQTTGIELH